jgi:hypothetical protein
MYTTDERITDEIERATNAESTINSRLSNEVTRAVAMETQIIEWLKHKVDAAEDLNVSITEDNGIIITVLNKDTTEQDSNYKLVAKDNKLALYKYNPDTASWQEEWSALLTTGPTQTVIDSIKVFTLTEAGNLRNGHAIQLSSEFIDDDTYEALDNETSIEIQFKRGNGAYKDSGTPSLFNAGVHKLKGTFDKLFAELYLNPKMDLPLIASSQTSIYNNAVTSGDINNTNFKKNDVLVTTGMIPSLINNDTSIKEAIQKAAGGLITVLLDAISVSMEVSHTVPSADATVTLNLDNNIAVGKAVAYHYKWNITNGTGYTIAFKRVVHVPNIPGAKFLVFMIQNTQYVTITDPDTGVSSIVERLNYENSSPESWNKCGSNLATSTSENITVDDVDWYYLDNIAGQGASANDQIQQLNNQLQPPTITKNNVANYITSSLSDLVLQHSCTAGNITGLSKIISANQEITSIQHGLSDRGTNVYGFHAVIYRIM